MFASGERDDGLEEVAGSENRRWLGQADACGVDGGKLVAELDVAGGVDDDFSCSRANDLEAIVEGAGGGGGGTADDRG